jgi:hypothetical protein
MFAMKSQPKGRREEARPARKGRSLGDVPARIEALSGPDRPEARHRGDYNVPGFGRNKFPASGARNTENSDVNYPAHENNLQVDEATRVRKAGRIMDIAAEIRRSARILLKHGITELPDNVVSELVRVGTAELETRKPKGRAPGEPRQNVEQDFTMLRRKTTLEALKREWSKSSLSADDRRKLAKNIVQTYERIRERDADFYDHSEPMRAAQRLINEGKKRRKAPPATLAAAGLS